MIVKSMYNYYRYKGVHHRLENIHNVSFRKVVPPFNSLHNILWHSFSLLVGARFYQYPLLLQHIIDDYPDRDYYMIVDECNVASQRGINKVGFELFAKGHKSRFGRYVIDKI